MKDIFETILANNKARTVVTVLATTVIVIACIGIGSTLAGSKSGNDANAAKEPNIVASETTDAAAAVTTDDAVGTVDVQNNNSDNSSDENSVSDTNSSSSTSKSASDNSGSSNGNYIGKAKAKSIALSKVGGGKVISCHLDHDDGIVEYDIEIIWGDYEYELEINAKTGKIIDFEKERIDYDDDDYDDHDDHHDDYDD